MTAYVCRLKANPKQEGIAIDKDILQINEGDVIVPKIMISVLWFDVRSPAPCFHEPQELEWLAIYDREDFEDYEEESEETEKTEEENDDLGEEKEEDGQV